MPRRTNAQRSRLRLTEDRDQLGADLQWSARVATADLVAVDLLEVEILRVQVAGAQPPGNPGVLTDHNPWNRGKTETGYVERARVGQASTMQSHLGEGRGDGGCQVRIVRQHCLAGRGAGTRHHPGVGPGLSQRL